MNVSRRTFSRAVGTGAVGGIFLGPKARAVEEFIELASEEHLKADVCVIGEGSAGT